MCLNYIISYIAAKKIISYIAAKKITETSHKKTFQKNVKRCRDDYAKKHSNKMPKSLQTSDQGVVGMVVCSLGRRGA